MESAIYHLYILVNSDSVSSLAERRADIEVTTGANGGTEPTNGTQPTNGGTPTEPSDGGLSPIIIIVPVVLIAAAAVVFFILRGGRAKKTG